MEITISEMIDRLSIINNKIFYLIDIIETSPDNELVASSARKMQLINRTRSDLKNAIEEKLGGGSREVKS